MVLGEPSSGRSTLLDALTSTWESIKDSDDETPVGISDLSAFTSSVGSQSNEAPAESTQNAAEDSTETTDDDVSGDGGRLQPQIIQRKWKFHTIKRGEAETAPVSRRGNTTKKKDVSQIPVTVTTLDFHNVPNYIYVRRLDFSFSRDSDGLI